MSMGATMSMNTLQDLYTEALQDLYDAEQQIVQALPQMIQAAEHADLRQALQEHEQQTRGQIQRLEQIFQRIGQQPGGKQSPGVRALIQETQQKIQQISDRNARDALLIAAEQKLEHYEIAGYGTARTWAVHMGAMDDAELLQQTADEEGAADKRLTQIAESHINREALRNPQQAAA